MRIKNPVFIFARGGSKGIKNKNLKKLNGIPLIQYTIDFALNFKKFDKVFVSTDSKKIRALCSKFDNVTVINRPKNLATDNSPELLSWKHALFFLNKKGIKLDKMIILPVTSPFRIKNDLTKAFKQFKKNVDLVVSVTEASKNPEFNMLKNNGKYLEIYKKTKKNIFRRQDAMKVYDMTTLFYIININYLKKTKKLLNGKIKGVEIPKSRALDIDSYYDFEFAKYIINKKKSNENIYKF